jgi:hypothetical protein
MNLYLLAEIHVTLRRSKDIFFHKKKRVRKGTKCLRKTGKHKPFLY